MPYTTADIRNIALVGQAGAGKTLIAEALLAHSGAIPSKGSLERGSTVCDFDPQEKTQLHSLDAAVCGFETAGSRVNIIDTPGYPDFLGRSLCALEAVETAVIVVSAVNGVEPMTHRMMDFARTRGLARLIVINRIDAREARTEQVLKEIRETFGQECLPLNLPAENGRSVVDCFFRADGKDTDFSSVESAHTEIIDQVVEVDEELMALYLEQGEDLSPEQLHDPFEQALRENHLIPICFCSAETGAGIAELQEVVLRLMPNPGEGNPPPFLKGEGEKAQRVVLHPDPDKHVIAHVFKVAIDPFVGKLGIFRVHQGTVKAGSQLFLGDARKPVKLAHLYQLQGKDHIEISEAIPGDICAVPKIDELHFDAVLHDSHDEDHFHLKSVAFPPPMLGLAVRAEKRGDEQKLSEGLHRLVAEDPCVRVEHHAAQNETVLYGLGDLHLKMMLERLTERYGVSVATSTPSIPYRETITRPAEGHHRHKKQTGGAGQFGEVFLRIEPLERGSGFEFSNNVVGGAIPGTFIPAVEKGVRQVLEEGAIAGFPLQDIRVSVYDGKHHAVDSKEVAFVAAGRKAFIAAIRESQPIVLEPIVKVAISTPAGGIGDVTSDLATRRARINGQNMLPGGRAEIVALVPLAEMQDFLPRLKALTGGEGSYSMDLSHYDPVPAREQKELVAAYQPKEDAD
jgi:elongation factor G